MPRTASSGLRSREQRERARARSARAHERHVQKTYGLAPGEYAQRFAAQDGRCAVCGRRSRRRLAVEHSHITGTVRGLVCGLCNRDVLGPLDGDPARIQRAIDFLTEMKRDLEHHLQGLSDPPMEADSPARRALHLPPIRVRRGDG